MLEKPNSDARQASDELVCFKAKIVELESKLREANRYITKGVETELEQLKTIERLQGMVDRLAGMVGNAKQSLCRFRKVCSVADAKTRAKAINLTDLNPLAGCLGDVERVKEGRILENLIRFSEAARQASDGVKEPGDG